MKSKIPEWSDWLKMTDMERMKCQNSWDVYRKQGEDVVEKVLIKFREEYGDIPKLEILGKGIYHCGIWVISIKHPLVFDRRKVPSIFLGIEVRAFISDENLPEEFQVGNTKKKYSWAPERYEKFVDKNMEKIRHELGNPNMDKLEMLSALCGQDFNEYIQQYTKKKH